MAGIYLHIPFCKQACVYCNFHFSTRLKNKGAMLQALLREAELRQAFVGKQTVESIYLGGGTPSLLSAREINQLLAKIQSLYSVSATAEITLEANPDDLSPAYLEALRQTAVNRLSIGIQSFRESDLQFMNRAHTAKDSLRCLQQAQEAGFTNLTVDLIYGLPHYPLSAWRDALQRLKDFGVPHFSAYALTVEPKTALNHQIEKGKLAPLEETLAADHFAELQAFARQNNYHHYELSNLAQPGHQAMHNSSYWQGKTYLGLGPAAHSFTPGLRTWNVANNTVYLKALDQNQLPLTSETLSLPDQYNEYVMTALRLEKGLDLSHLKAKFGTTYHDYAIEQAKALLQQGRLQRKGSQIFIPPQQRFYSDGLAAELFWV
jgi:oxygen-independent coproporphyrinogen-3 oxidase